MSDTSDPELLTHDGHAVAELLPWPDHIQCLGQSQHLGYPQSVPWLQAFQPGDAPLKKVQVGAEVKVSFFTIAPLQLGSLQNPIITFTTNNL